MAGVSDEIKIRILTETKESIANLAKWALGIGAAYMAVKKFVSVVSDLEEKFFKQEQAETKLASVLKSTGNTAGYTASQLAEMANEMQRTTTFGDEVVMSGQAVLATFTKIGRTVFPEAIRAAADMSTVMGQDLQASIVQVGKALNDPIAGVGALRKVGVQLTEAQEKSIKAFVAQGDVISAQKIILGELSTEFGGAAVAMGDTAYGATVKLSNAFGDLKEAMGGLIAGAQGGFVSRLTSGIQQISNWFAMQGLPEGLQRTSLEVARVQARINELKVTLASMPERGILSAGRGKIERQLADAQEDMTAALIKRGEYMRSVNAKQREELEGLEKAARLRGEEEAKLANITRLQEDWAKTEAGKLAAVKELIAYYSSSIFDQNSQMVKDTLAHYRAQLPVLKESEYIEIGISEAAWAWAEATKDTRAYTSEIADALRNDINPAVWAFNEGMLNVGASAHEVNVEFKEIIGELQKGLKSVVTSGAVSSLKAIGAAMADSADGAKSFAESMGDVLSSILNALPMLFIQAGLKMLPSPEGWALLAAGGISAIAAGAFDASRSSEVPSASSAAPSAGRSVTVVNNYNGAVIQERRFDARAAAGVARVAGAY